MSISDILFGVSAHIGHKEVVCQASYARTAAVVLLLLSALFTSTGLYLLLGKIGTVSALSTGWAFVALGIGFFSAGNITFFKHICNCTKNS